jgi:hypothetical protein
MTEKRNSLDNNSVVGKIKEIILILIFTFISAAVGILLSDIFILPLTYFSISNINTFNLFFKYAFIFFIITACVLWIFSKIRSFRKDGHSTIAIIKYIILKPIQYFGLIILSIFLLTGIIYILYIFFSKNYYLIYKLSGGI